MTTLPILDHTERDRDEMIRIRKPRPRDVSEDGSYSPSDAIPDSDLVDAVIRTAIEEDAVIDFGGRGGARPYMRFTPWWNQRGARNPMWSCISYTMKPMPGRTMLGWPNIIEPSREPSNEWGTYTPRYFSTEWVWAEVHKSTFVYLRTIEASPFTESMFKWSPDPREEDDFRTDGGRSVTDNDRDVPKGTSDIVCTECHTSPRLKSLRKNSGTVVGCSCDAARYSMDSVPYELSIHDLPDAWVVVEGRAARQLAHEVDLCIEADVYECPRCGDTFGIKETAASCSSCGYIPRQNRWQPEHIVGDPEDNTMPEGQGTLTDGGFKSSLQSGRDE